jgi:hypothetical protein
MAGARAGVMKSGTVHFEVSFEHGQAVFKAKTASMWKFW